MTSETGQKFANLIIAFVISVAVTGYFIGLQSPMNPAKAMSANREIDAPESAHLNSSDVIPATDYAGMGARTKQRAKSWQTSLTGLDFEVDGLAEVTISPDQKSFALALREQNRAFNGAPPTIPHAIDQMSTKACMACHGTGIKTQSLRISRMSHQFLANCTQCHAENNPDHMPATAFRENSFVGLPAPTAGERAFEGAPPTIPHSTWMRTDCMSCHGFSGLQGIRSTHPWRTNCQQCHAPSSQLDQVEIDSLPKFLPPPKVDSPLKSDNQPEDPSQ